MGSAIHTTALGKTQTCSSHLLYDFFDTIAKFRDTGHKLLEPRAVGFIQYLGVGRGGLDRHVGMDVFNFANQSNLLLNETYSRDGHARRKRPRCLFHLVCRLEEETPFD
jgi:hypothetical protein